METEGIKGSASQPPSSLRREVDSLDDFEHLGHDSSPLKDSVSLDTGALSAGKTPSPDPRDLINTGGEKVAIAANHYSDDFAAFDPLVSQKMDSNLLQMGDNFPDRKDADDKLDKFLQDLSFTPSKHQESPEFRDKDVEKSASATQNFMDMERNQAKNSLHSSSEQLERYTDSEPDNDDDFKIPKYEDFPIKKELPPAVPQKDYLEQQQAKKPELAAKPEPVVAKPQPEPVVAKPKPEPVAPAKPEPVCVKPEPVCAKPEPVGKKPKTVIDAEAIFCRMGLDAWFNPERLNPRVESLIYWRDPKKSGPVFGGVLLVLLALTYFSLISVVAYLSLLALTGTISFRIYKNIVQAVQKTGDGHPFKEFLEYDVALPQEKVKEVSEIAVAHLNAGFVEVRRLFLVEDLVDSIKFGVLLWTLTYLGAWFNGMTLIIIAWVALFTLPKVYEANKTQIDANLEIVRTKLAEITSKVKAAIPIGKKTEEKKEQ